MKLGRFITITDVYQYIDTYLGGTPFLMLGFGTTDVCTVQNDEGFNPNFDWVFSDNCDLFVPSYPNQVTIPLKWQGLYDVFVQVNWEYVPGGCRFARFVGVSVYDEPGPELHAVNSNLSGMVFGPAWEWPMELYQNSGGPVSVDGILYLRWVQPLPAYTPLP